MIRRYNDDTEFYECSKCGNTFKRNQFKCPSCNNISIGIQHKKNSFEFEEPNNDDLTICGVVSTQTSDNFIFTELKIDNTPNELTDRPFFQQNRMFKQDSNTFYMFNQSKMSIITGQQLNLNLKNFDHFIKDGFSIFYNRKDFTNHEIIELKSYNFK